MLGSKIIAHFRGVDVVRYAEDASDTERIDRFNFIWKYAYTNYSFYNNYKRIHDLPESISSLQQILSFPFITRDEIKKNSKLILKESKVIAVATTGGTSGTPLVIPFSKSDRILDYRNIYSFRKHILGRGQGKILLLWGHSHLFGKGVMRYFWQVVRFLKDCILGIKRVSAYGAVEELYQQAVIAMRKNKFDFLIGYSSYIVKIARKINKNCHTSFNCPSIIILTAETFTNTDYLEVGKAFCNSLIVTEYGASETGVIAGGVPGSIKVFADFLLNYDREHGVIITTLSERSFPLIRYSIGDFLSDLKEDKSRVIVEFGLVSGRANDEVALVSLDGSTRSFSSLEIQHFVRSDVLVHSIQIQRSCSEKNVYLMVVIDDPCDAEIFECQVRGNFKSVFKDIDLSYVKFSYVDEPIKTLAGKILFKLPDRV